MSKIIKLKPFFSERLWGGRNLENYGFNLPDNKKIGEAWVISAMDNGMSYLQSNEYQNISLKDFFESNKGKYFNKELEDFPLLLKMISSNDYLSVQVHPNEEYANKVENCHGKPECWYIIDAPENAELIYGHNAKSPEELENLVSNHKWDKLFKKIKIRKDDFLYVPPGKIHAISPGVTVLELQIASDITYRFYDFDRKDANGELRPLHIQKCLDVTTVPDDNLGIIRKSEGVLIDNEYFSLHVYTNETNVKRNIPLEVSKWCLISCVEGAAIISGEHLKQGESAIVLDVDQNLTFEGQAKVLISYKI